MKEDPASENEKVKIIIADDHPLVINGLTELFEKEPHFEIIATYNDGEMLVKSNRLADADVIVLDLNMPSLDGLEVLEHIKPMNLKGKVIILTSYLSELLAGKCRDAGASAYCLKSENLDTLSEIIEEVVAGTHHYAEISKQSEGQGSDFTYLDEFLQKYNLTKRETEVITMVCKGYNSKEIAQKLYVSSFTVQTHRRNIFRKLKIEGSTIALYKFASEHGLI